MNDCYDVLIIGYGPAGVSASLYALRAGFDVQLVGKDSGALGNAHFIENYYGLERPLSGLELFEIGKSQALKLGAKIAEDEIVDLMFDGKIFIARSKNAVYKGKACILSTGAMRKKVQWKGLQELEGHGVSYCAVCDAFFYKEKNVCVLGNGEYALNEVQELLHVTKSVTLLTDGKPLTASFPSSVKIEDRKIESLKGTSKFEGVTFEDGNAELFDGLFIALGSASALDLARHSGAAFENGKIVLNNFMTTVRGLFVAGDATGGTLQIAVAVGEGALAGLAVNKFLREVE